MIAGYLPEFDGKNIPGTSPIVLSQFKYVPDYASGSMEPEDGRHV